MVNYDTQDYEQSEEIDYDEADEDDPFGDIWGWGLLRYTKRISSDRVKNNAKYLKFSLFLPIQ